MFYKSLMKELGFLLGLDFAERVRLRKNGKARKKFQLGFREEQMWGGSV